MVIWVSRQSECLWKEQSLSSYVVPQCQLPILGRAEQARKIILKIASWDWLGPFETNLIDVNWIHKHTLVYIKAHTQPHWCAWLTGKCLNMCPLLCIKHRGQMRAAPLCQKACSGPRISLGGRQVRHSLVYREAWLSGLHWVSPLPEPKILLIHRATEHIWPSPKAIVRWLFFSRGIKTKPEMSPLLSQPFHPVWAFLFPIPAFFPPLSSFTWLCFLICSVTDFSCH